MHNYKKNVFPVSVFSVRMCLCTICELLRVVHAGVFAAVFEGRV